MELGVEVGVGDKVRVRTGDGVRVIRPMSTHSVLLLSRLKPSSSFNLLLGPTSTLPSLISCRFLSVSSTLVGVLYVPADFFPPCV